jgi:hypothetical protein
MVSDVFHWVEPGEWDWWVPETWEAAACALALAAIAALNEAIESTFAFT